MDTSLWLTLRIIKKIDYDNNCPFREWFYNRVNFQRSSLCHFHCCCCLVASVVSKSAWPYGLQPARLLCPLDSLSKNSGVGCHFLLRGSSPPRDQIRTSYISWIGSLVLYHQHDIREAEVKQLFLPSKSQCIDLGTVPFQTSCTGSFGCQGIALRPTALSPPTGSPPADY